MPKWKIGAQGNNSTTFYVTFTANTSLVGYRVLGYSFGKDAAAAAVATIAFQNVVNDNGSTATLFCGSPSVCGDCMLFPTDGFIVKANQTCFATLTWAAASPATGTLAVAYEMISKQP